LMYVHVVDNEPLKKDMNWIERLDLGVLFLGQ